jgi:hypothetical protein
VLKIFFNKFVHTLGAWRPLLLAGNTLMLGMTCSTAAYAATPGFTIKRAETKLVDQVYQLSVQIDYRFSQKVLDAIESGVPIVLVLDIEVRRPRSFMWDEQIAQLRQRFQLQYHALTEQYIVKNLNSGAQNTAPTLNTALYYLRDINNVPLIDQQLLNPKQHYQVRLKMSMEFDSLPVPLKLSAYLSRSWWLGSDWFVWNL